MRVEYDERTIAVRKKADSYTVIGIFILVALTGACSAILSFAGISEARIISYTMLVLLGVFSIIHVITFAYFNRKM